MTDREWNLFCLGMLVGAIIFGFALALSFALA